MGEIGLGQHDAVGDGGLFNRLWKLGELSRAVHRIDHRDDAAEPEMVLQNRLADQREGDRDRVGEAAGLDDDATEARDFAAFAPREQIAQRVLDILAERAAQTAVIEQHRRFVGLADQVVVEADLAKLVDQNGDVRHARRHQHSL